jgi:hypothetical protein
LPENERIYTFDNDKISHLLDILSKTHCRLCCENSNLENFDELQSDIHIEKALIYARRAGEENTQPLYDALSKKASLLTSREKDNEAKVLYEEAYKLVSALHSIDNPLVLRAAEDLITNLMHLENYESAEPIARICYESLTRPVDCESQDIAESALRLGEA